MPTIISQSSSFQTWHAPLQRLIHKILHAQLDENLVKILLLEQNDGTLSFKVNMSATVKYRFAVQANVNVYNMSRVMRKSDFCLCENIGADQLCSNCTADLRLCFRTSDSTISLLLIAKISSLKPASVNLQADLCRIWSETPKTVFLRGGS